MDCVPWLTMTVFARALPLFPSSAKCGYCAEYVRLQMNIDDQKFMATEGLIQWLAACVRQGQKLAELYARLFLDTNALERRLAILDSHTQGHFFVIAAAHVLGYRAWARNLGMLSQVDFSEIDKFNQRDIRDLRNMREHVVDYFSGIGNNQDRWIIETPEYSADASSVVGTLIGGRLDYQAFSVAAEIVLQEVLNASNRQNHR